MCFLFPTVNPFDRNNLEKCYLYDSVMTEIFFAFIFSVLMAAVIQHFYKQYKTYHFSSLYYMHNKLQKDKTFCKKLIAEIRELVPLKSKLREIMLPQEELIEVEKYYEEKHNKPPSMKEVERFIMEAKLSLTLSFLSYPFKTKSFRVIVCNYPEDDLSDSTEEHISEKMRAYAAFGILGELGFSNNSRDNLFMVSLCAYIIALMKVRTSPWTILGTDKASEIKKNMEKSIKKCYLDVTYLMTVQRYETLKAAKKMIDGEIVTQRADQRIHTDSFLKFFPFHDYSPTLASYIYKVSEIFVTANLVLATVTVLVINLSWWSKEKYLGKDGGCSRNNEVYLCSYPDAYTIYVFLFSWIALAVCFIGCYWDIFCDFHTMYLKCDKFFSSKLRNAKKSPCQ